MPAVALNTLVRRLKRAVAPEADGLTDAQLLDRWLAQRDEAALEVLLWRHGPMVLGVCRRVLRHRQDAEDAFQATFLALVDRAASIRHREAIGSWLYRVAYRAALAARRRQADSPSPADRTDERAASPIQEAVRGEFWRVIDEELARLPEKYRWPFVLCFLEGRTNDEAARELNCPVGTVATRLRWARGRLSARLSRRGLALSGAALTIMFAHAAAVPRSELVAASVRAAASFAESGAASAPPQVLSLARGVVKSMSLTRLKTVAAVVTALALIAGGVGLVAQSAHAPAREEGPPSRLTAAKDSDRKPEQKRPAGQGPRDLLLRWGGGTAESEAAVAAGLDWLVRHQGEDGHWTVERGVKGDAADVAGTALGLLPFLGAGITPKSKDADKAHVRAVERGLKWLLDRQTKEGDFGCNFMYAHGLATMAVCQAYGLTADADLKEPAQRATAYVETAQSESGGWRYTPGSGGGDTSITGWQVQALWFAKASGLDVKQTTFDRASKWLDHVQSPDGGYGYVGPQPTATMTASGLVSRQLLGWSAGNANLAAGVDSLGKMKAVTDNLYDTYYTTHAFFLAGGQAWQGYNAAARDRLVAAQEKGPQAGDEKGSWPSANDAFGKSTGRLYTTSLALLTLEVYYRLDLVLEARTPREGEAKDVDKLWSDLAATDLAGRQSVWVLARDPKRAVALIRDKVRPVTPPTAAEAKRVEELVRDLDSDSFQARESATQELAKLGAKAEGGLRRALDARPSPEVRMRAERLLEKIETVGVAERLRTVRALGVLECADTAEARELLESLAKGAADAWLTRQAKAALERLAAQRP